VTRDGIALHYEVFGQGVKTVLLLPTWSLVHSRHWKAQVPYLSRHFRVVTFDGRGSGRSTRPASADAYADAEFVADALAVMDASGTESAVLVALSAGGRWALQLAADHPDRVGGVVFIAPAVPLAPPVPGRGEAIRRFNEVRDDHDGWAKWNRHYWLSNYRDFLEFFFLQGLAEPHSTKQREDCVGWGLETTPETLIETVLGQGLTQEQATDMAARVRCPVLVIHGDEDAIVPWSRGNALAEAIGCRIVTMVGSGHFPHARDPVKTNLLLRDFIGPRQPSPQWHRSKKRPKRALFISSPIGLGHAQRDVAIAQELRKIHPDLTIDWLAQHPVTDVLKLHGERIHPASVHLASESAHIESESAEHDLHCFQAVRRMDEILVANFMLFHDVVVEDHYDLWIGDEAWDIDHFLHENPELKRAPYVWLTDFVGWIPMTDGGEHEASLTADYNAEMIEHIARFPRLRDRAVFVGNPEDIVPHAFGAELPRIRDWTEAHYAFSGYVTGFDPVDLGTREELRARLGYRAGEKVCIVSVGGSGVGAPLIRRIMAAYPQAKRRVPGLRMIVVAGPRIARESLPAHDEIEVRTYVPNLYMHLAACDIAVVQGGLTTTMELTANKRPFIYFPLGHHFEQNFHVRHRLKRYGAGRCMDYRNAEPELIAEAIAEELDRPIRYRDVETDGAAKAAQLIGELL